MHMKKIVAESYEMAVGWKEEISLVRQEMSNFLKLYMRLLQESDEETDEEEVFRNEIVDNVHESVIRIPIHVLHTGVVVWDFPKEISQSTLNGRCGSNACSVIALLLAQGIHKADPILPAAWVNLVVHIDRNGEYLA